MSKPALDSSTSLVPQASIELVENNNLRVIGDLSFKSVPALALQSREYFSGDNVVDVDLANVTRADSAGVALLIEWQRLSEKQNKSICFFNVPSQMMAIAQLCGVDELLSLKS